MSLENLEIALNMCFELSRLNNTQDLFYDFWRFVIQWYEEFPYEYKMNSHSRKQHAGSHEKHLCLFLMKMCCYKCSMQNCQISSRIMTLLGYKSYHETPKRFRQKVENYLRRERKEGGSVPPSSRSLPLYSFIPSNSINPSSGPVTRSATRLLYADQQQKGLTSHLTCLHLRQSLHHLRRTKGDDYDSSVLVMKKQNGYEDNKGSFGNRVSGCLVRCG